MALSTSYVISTLSLTKYAFGFVWKEKQGKLYVILMLLQSIWNALFPMVLVVLPGWIINELTGNQRVTYILSYVLFLVVVPVLSRILNAAFRSGLTNLRLKLSLCFEEEFFLHSAQMDYYKLENPEIQTQKGRAQQALNNLIKTVDTLFELLSGIIALVVISYLIATINVFVILLIVGIVAVNSFVAKKINYQKHLLSQELSKYDLHQGAYTYMLEHFSYAKEIRLFDISKFLVSVLINSKKESSKLEMKMQLSSNKLDIFYAITIFIQQVAIYGYLVFSVLKKIISVGDMTIFLSATDRFANSLSSIFNSYLKIANICLNLQELQEFMNIPMEQISSGTRTAIYKQDSTIEFKNVSFKYPGSQNYALRNINIVIKPSERLCIVGSNGSGKSTFIKLLTRLYFPTEGEILLDGVNINEFEYNSYQRLFAPVFQDFADYYMTLGQNIALSNEYSASKMDSVCRQSGLTKLVDKLSKGYETQVGKWLDEEGFDPSGGENQRIAIARACYRGGEIFLLDEPTAALDPLAEHEIYTQFNKMITQKTAVLITHRLSAVQLADNVAVFEQGELVEYGTHQSLYDQHNLYYEMFEKQSKFYRNTEKQKVEE